MKKILWVLGVGILLFVHQVNAQAEVRGYIGLGDFWGVEGEYLINEKMGVAVGGHWRTNKSENYFIDDNIGARRNTAYLHAKYKWYFQKEKAANMGLFLGGYLRFYNQAYKLEDRSEWTQAQVDYLDSAEVIEKEYTYKLSIGALFGYKGSFSEDVHWEIAAGLGGSPFGLYWERLISNQNTYINRIPPSEIFGNVEYLSLLLQFGIGYRF